MVTEKPIKPTESWLQFYRDIAQMRVDIELLENDLLYEKQGGKIFYAVDTNVSLMFAHPLDFKSKESARTFKDEDGEVLNAVSISLVDTLFTNGLLATADAMLLLPELAEELSDQFRKLRDDSVNDRLNAEFNEDVKEKISNLINQINDASDSSAAKLALTTYLLNECKDLVCYLHDDLTSASSAVSRLVNLAKQEKLRNIDKSLPQPDPAEIEELGYKWHERLKILKKDAIGMLSHNDAKALARITLINEQLLRDGDQQRLYYLSNDNALHQFVKEEISLKYEFSPNPPALKSIFRYPYQYVHALRFTSTQDLDTKLKQLNELKAPVDEFLKPFGDLKVQADFLHRYLRVLRRFVFKPERDDVHTKRIIEIFQGMDNAEAKYQDLKQHRMELLALRTMTKALSAADMASDLAQKLCEQGIDKMLEEKRLTITKKITEKFETFGVIGFSAAYLENIESYHASLHGKPLMSWPRGPVSLKRGLGVSGEQAFFERIHQLVFNRKWSALYDVIDGESSYIKHLIYALIAADAGQWAKARQCCEDALKAADEDPKSCGNTNEGWYFLAVALRHDCQNADDYEAAIKARKQGLKIWQRRFGCDDLRFESERLALETAYVNYNYFEGWRVTDNEPNFVKTWEALQLLAEKIENDSTEPEIVRERIKRQVYSNLCYLFIYDWCMGNKSVRVQEKQTAYNKLQSLSEQNEFRSSYFIQFLLAFSKWHLAPKSEKKAYFPMAYQETVNAMTSPSIPYEQKKFAYFKEYLEQKKYS